MNNSDIIAALSLAITAIIFLLQTDDGLLKLKVKKYEKWFVGIMVVVIILLINYQVFDRFDISFYFTVFGKYLLPMEWALMLFLVLLGLTLFRIFTPKIFNHDSRVILGLINQYRSEKKWNKLNNLLLQVMALEEFEELYADKLNDTLFNDPHLIEHFASDYPEMLIKFCESYRSASIMRGEHFFHILNGLFANKSNTIFSEIRHYHNDERKRVFLEELWSLSYEDKKEIFDPKANYRTDLPIISWLTNILETFPSNLKEEARYFFRQYPETGGDKNNMEIFTEDEIKRLLSRDTVFNVIQLFRILIIEFSLNNSRANILIDRVLLLLYSAWDFIEQSTQNKSEDKVALNNDSYTINEYFLKYMFYSYLSIYLLLRYKRPAAEKLINEAHDSSSWPMQQLFAKLDSLIGHNGFISDRSKEYYMSELFQFYLEMFRYFLNEKDSKDSNEILLWYIKDSLKASPYGDVTLFREIFNKVCDSFDFIAYDRPQDIKLIKKHFYESLLPYTKDHEWRIVRM